MPKETNYFQHDYNARNHIKLRRLRQGHGAAGYGLYWYLVEMMHEDERNGIDIDQDVIDFLAHDNLMNVEAVCSCLTDCVEKYKLFTVSNGFYTSERVIENKDRREQIRMARREAGKKGGQKRVENSSNCLAIASNSQAIAKQNEANPTKGKESKGKSIEERKLFISEKQKALYNSLVPFVEQYGKDMLRAFYDYWHQPNSTYTKIRWEMEKTWDLEARLRFWANNNRNFGRQQKQPQGLDDKEKQKIFGD